jgi:hypothetical protein
LFSSIPPDKCWEFTVMVSVHTSHSSVQLQNFVDKPPIINLVFCGGISPSKVNAIYISHNIPLICKLILLNLRIWQLRKIVCKSGSLINIQYVRWVCKFILCYLDLNEPVKLLEIMVSKDPKMSKQCAAGKTKNVTLTTPYKLEIIRTIECGKSCSVVTASYSIGLSTTDMYCFMQFRFNATIKFKPLFEFMP